MAYNPNVPAPANRVQDDIAAMRGNFQHLAPLAQAVGELQAVSGLAPVIEELQAVSALAPYVQALLDSRIVEMGSNANGEYVRWGNGLQMCFHTGPVVPVDASSYAVYEWNQFPASFNEIWSVLGAAAPTGASVVSRLTRSTLGVVGGVYRLWIVNDASEVRNMTPYFLAIGRWK